MVTPNEHEKHNQSNEDSMSLDHWIHLMKQSNTRYENPQLKDFDPKQRQNLNLPLQSFQHPTNAAMPQGQISPAISSY